MGSRLSMRMTIIRPLRGTSRQLLSLCQVHRQDIESLPLMSPSFVTTEPAIGSMAERSPCAAKKISAQSGETADRPRMSLGSLKLRSLITESMQSQNTLSMALRESSVPETIDKIVSSRNASLPRTLPRRDHPFKALLAYFLCCRQLRPDKIETGVPTGKQGVIKCLLKSI